MLERKSTYSIGNVPAGFQSEVERLKAQAVMGWDKEFPQSEVVWLAQRNACA